MRSLTKLQKSALIAFSAYLLALVWVITLKCNMVQVVAESRYFVGQQSENGGGVGTVMTGAKSAWDKAKERSL